VVTAVGEVSKRRGKPLQLPVPGVFFTSFTLNVDERCICGPHVDGSNLASGMCLVSPIGNFDPQKGGHLILHNLKLIFEVAPGSICLIPSAIITHSNIGIGPGETRRAITAYTPASYFQYYEEGFKGVLERLHKEAKALGRRRWADGKARLPHYDQIW